MKDDPRQPLRGTLRAHAARPLDPRETVMTTDAIRFAGEHAGCLLRSCVPGHFTGSARIVDVTRRWTLLARHGKLDKWLQVGGHADGDGDLLAVALREIREEAELTRLRPRSEIIFDFDRHMISARGAEQGHYHHDLRFLIEADRDEQLVISGESHELAWIELDQVGRFNADESMMRMGLKTLALQLR